MIRTFLFTDIESSTRLWEEHPAEMAGALERHDSIVTAGIQTGRGQVLKTTGDGVVAVFDSAGDAVSAAIAVQRELRDTQWEKTGPLRVRMGIHSGEAEARAGDYFGRTLNRTARIMAAGHGGQVLLSASAAADVDRNPPGGATLRDLGSHRLKDLTDPERLFQLVHPDLATEFSDLLTLDTRPNNLPRQVTEFLGRAEELAAIQLMLESDRTRLLTLAGPGGAGKTRLALQVAAAQVEEFRDGVFFVDLSTERDADAAFEAVVRALGLTVTGDEDPLNALEVRLRDRNMLLVLDNFEQLMTAASGVNQLIQSCPELKILVTSRETLRVRGERVFPVPSLSLPDPSASLSRIAESEAVQLFVERARSVRPDFAITEETSGAVAEICLRLDGLPLAIELAAARLNVFTPAELLNRLRERLDILGAGGRDLPDRQRTLWGAIGWSYELLDEDERELFEMMSVFSSTKMPALETVAASALGMEMAFESLSSLVDKSLVRSNTAGDVTTFSMLLMIKEYAAAQLAESPKRAEDVRRAHALHFSAFAVALQDRLRGEDRDRALADLESEIGNLRTAWGYWVEHGDLEQLFILLDGLWALHEAKGWYRAAIELAKDTLNVLSTVETSPELAAEELILRTSLARALMAIRGYDEEVEEAFKAALAVSEAGGTPAQRFPVLRAMASYYTLSGDVREAASIGQRLLDLGEETDDDAIRTEGHYVVGMAISFGDVDVSLPHLDRAIELYDPKKHGSNRFRVGPNTGVVARTASAMTLWLKGDLTKAVDRIADSLALARRIEHPFSLAYALHHNGYMSVMRRRFDDCLGFANELGLVARENEYQIWETLSTVLEGVALTGLGDTQEGVDKTEAGIDLYLGLTTPPVFWPFLLALRAMVHAMAGNPERALGLIEEAMEIDRSGGAQPPGLGILKADLMLMLPDPDMEESERLYVEEIEASRQLKLALVELQARTGLVAVRREIGSADDGSNQLAELLATFHEGLDEYDLVRARALIA